MSGVAYGARENYGGFKYDRAACRSILAGLNKEEADVVDAAFLPLIWLDMPLSLAADTLLLPFTAPRARRAAQREAAPAR